MRMRQLKVHPEWRANLAKDLAERPVINVSLEVSSRSATGLLAITREFLMPLVRVASECRLYKERQLRDDRAGAPSKVQLDRWLSTYVQRSRGVSTIDVAAEGVRGDVAFWNWVLDSDTVAGIRVPASAFDSACFANGRSFGNEGSWTGVRKYLSDSGVAWARRVSANTGDVIAVPYFAGRAHVALIARPAVLVDVMLRCLETHPIPATNYEWFAHWEHIESHPLVRGATAQQLRKQFDEDAAPHELLAAKLTYPKGADRKSAAGDYSGSLMSAVSGRSPADPFAEAHIAAELVAALGGQPPTTLEKAHTKALRQWAARNEPPRAPLIAAAITAARRVRTSAYPRHRFLTDVARDEWRAMVADLERRLELAGQATDADESERAIRGAMHSLRRADMAKRLLIPEVVKEFHFIAHGADAVDVTWRLVRETDARAFRPRGRTLEAMADKGAVEDYLLPHYAQESTEEYLHRLRRPVVLWWPAVGGKIRTYRQRPYWGLATLFFAPVRWGKFVTSLLEYPTGEELSQRRYAGEGPWRSVHWARLRLTILHARRLIRSAAAAEVTNHTRLPVLPNAWALARKGQVQIGVPSRDGVHSVRPKRGHKR